ncbi:MAG: protein kinase [Myxococcaceae bacterium]|nr:protein kinase [Myxococcaceae bacterium]
MTDGRGARPRAKGACPSCGQVFDLSLRVCPTHKVPLVEPATRPTEVASLFDESDARTDLDRTILGAEAPVTLPAAPAVPALLAPRLAQAAPDATLLEPALRPYAPEETPLESSPVQAAASSRRGPAPPPDQPPPAPASSRRSLQPVSADEGSQAAVSSRRSPQPGSTADETSQAAASSRRSSQPASTAEETSQPAASSRRSLQPVPPVDEGPARPGSFGPTPRLPRGRLPDVTPVDAPAVAPLRKDAPTQPAGVPAIPLVNVAMGSASRPPDKPAPSRSASNLGTPLTSVAGQLFDGYLTTGVLAEGGMGIVYEAQHPILGTQAVVKVLKKLLTADPVSMRRMVTEGQTLSALTHRNVVRVFGFGYLADGRPWLLMERLVGETLYSLLEGRGALPLTDALPLMRQLAAGLEATHALGVVHRDLKPDNVYVVVEPDGERLVKLIDFGIARPDTLEAPADARTAVGRFVGTPAYGAPELFVGSPCSLAADVYALGIVFFEMLAGRRPFVETDLPTLTKHHLDTEPPRLASLVKGVDPRMDALVASMLSKRPDERPTIEAVRAALEVLATPAPRPTSALPWVLVGILTVALGLGLAWLLR